MCSAVVPVPRHAGDEEWAAHLHGQAVTVLDPSVLRVEPPDERSEGDRRQPLGSSFGEARDLGDRGDQLVETLEVVVGAEL